MIAFLPLLSYCWMAKAEKISQVQQQGSFSSGIANL
jgi:hypothetical protein